MKKFLIFAALSIPAFFFYNYQFSETEAKSFGDPENSSVATSVVKADGGSLNFTIKINLKEGIAFNMDAPWKLSIKKFDGLTLDKTESVAKDFVSELPGYKFQSIGKPTLPAGKIEYSLIAFICTKDKSRCFREVHNGNIDWANP
jgi:hypothetical protein